MLNTGQVCMFTHSFRQYQIILLCYRGSGLLEGFYVHQRHDPELTPCQRELKFDVLPVTPPRYVARLYVCRKNLWQVYRPTTVFCGTDLLYQTQYEIQITVGSGSMNESLIDTVGCLCSIAVYRCVFHSFTTYMFSIFFSIWNKSVWYVNSDIRITVKIWCNSCLYLLILQDSVFNDLVDDLSSGNVYVQ